MNDSRFRCDLLRLTALAGSLFATVLAVGCAAQPVMTQVIYEDRSAWIRLETNPDADKSVTASGNEPTPPSSTTIAALLRGFRSEKDYTPGVISFAMGKSYYNNTFVEPELMVLTPQLAKGLATASPKERVAYCLTVDYLPDERFITTGWVYIKGPHLYFKLVEWRTPIRVKSPAVATSEACQVKPIPGVKTADRFFKIDYSPKSLIETYGPLGGSIMNKRGEVVFKLAGLDLAKLPVGGQSNGARNSANALEASGQPQPTAAPTQQAEPPKEVPSKRKNPSGGSTPAKR
jgi:hypothetical protein